MRVVLRPEPRAWQALTRRPTRPLAESVDRVQPIIDEVRRRGDTALLDLTARYDGVRLDAIRVPEEDLAGARSEIAQDLQRAIRTAMVNIETFHEAQRDPVRRIETTRGVTCWRKSIPIQSVGLYIPGGTAPLFSTVLMLGVPARLAGCPRVVLCTPPSPDGTVHPAIRYAAHLVGITEVFPVGGAQAIAAMTYGTESIPRVDKIFGPGNQWVTAAKQWASLVGTGIDLPAGPTELGILADSTADPEFIAADILSQAEHGIDSHVFVVLTDEALVNPIQLAVQRQLTDLPRADVAAAALEHSVMVVADGLDQAVDLINAYAAEHLILAMDDAASVAERILHAGSVFVGHLSPESAGDYASGTNHTLPTGGAARAFSGVSLDSFVRKVTFQELSPDGLRRLGPDVAVLAAAEQLEGHARAVTRRLATLDSAPENHRTGEVSRHTAETEIFVRIDLDGTGRGRIDTGLAFLDHMLMQIARHGEVDLDIRVRGDLEVDEHHTVEDTAIALGTALRKALGDKRGIERYGFLLPMDEALAQVALDFGGRSHLVWDVTFTRDRVGDVPTELWPHFFKSLCDAAACNLNIRATGENDHHLIESVFKGLARSLRAAVRRDPHSLSVPSTKGTL